MLPSPRTSRARLHGLLVVPVVALTALTSCGDRAHTSPPPASIDGAVGTGVQARKSGPAAHLLAADAMPTAGASWSRTDTSSDDFEVVGPCHLASLVDIGALNAVRRTWTAEGPAPRAIQVVARFADNKSAWRAHQVLDSWQGDCAGRVEGTVGSLHEVAVATGAGQAYRLDQGDRATDVGVLRKGAYLSVVSVLGAAAKVPDDSALAKAAVKRIAATF